ncbi:MAG: antitoxin [Anaerolineaceae bacterium]|nr:antitoxin [Anaerolineaceae bacterium]
MIVKTAKLFINGRSQAVRLPKEFRFEGSEVYIRKEGDEVILSAKKPSWDEFFNMNSAFGDDFLRERDNEPPQERESLS